VHVFPQPEIDVLLPEDLPALVACMLLDAAVFPHPSVNFGTEVRRAGSRVWVLRQLGEVRGFAALRVRLREGYIMGFAVAPAFQGRGLGGLLLDRVLDFTKELELVRIDLHVSAENAAGVALYESRAFRKSKRVPRFYGADEDAFVMSHRLPCEGATG
jgi:ribosomal protein S18 acetylase RimI-like enzyme